MIGYAPGLNLVLRFTKKLSFKKRPQGFQIKSLQDFKNTSKIKNSRKEALSQLKDS
jgi:hypothetical protein